MEVQMFLKPENWSLQACSEFEVVIEICFACKISRASTYLSFFMSPNLKNKYTEKAFLARPFESSTPSNPYDVKPDFKACLRLGSSRRLVLP